MKKIIMALVAVALGGIVTAAPVFASCGGAETALIHCDEPSGEGGIMYVLQSAIDILTVLVGIVGVIGITIVGIQYLTAGGSEEKTRKAKRRMLEIIIGIAVFVLMDALLKWLGVFNQ